MTSPDAVLAAGSPLAFTSAGAAIADGSFCQMVVGGAPTALAFPLASCAVPADLFGPVFIYVRAGALRCARSLVPSLR